ncbi:tetratricopeptide repeat protein [Pararhizobium gei]|uniref:tetratricopeptide repeat protein n=1 Tax=Pararhizobium gei TaxID=1395951 RepID=UPI0023DA89EC|nr:tetratricopeptide repeat protein [Rhizobium gei]
MRLWTAGLFLVLGAVVAHAGPKKTTEQLTWEWFNAGETYRRYKVKGPDDLKISTHYFHLAAKSGNSAAAYKVGEAYENGIGVKQDPAVALDWYRVAAAAGDRHAELRIGWFYHKGITVPADPAMAAQWYRRSADKDNIWAYHMLAFMLMDGEGVPQDRDLARHYFEKSLPVTNDHWAKVKLARLIEESDPSRSLALLQQAETAGNPEATKRLRDKR